jgi:hypothetical protein
MAPRMAHDHLWGSTALKRKMSRRIVLRINPNGTKM